MGPKPINAINISLEICSEYPGYLENCPSDIYFYLNNLLLGVWTSPGDFGANKGIYTPDWWNAGTQYGMQKNISIRHNGCYIDGIPLSDLTLDKIQIIYGKDLKFRIAVPKDAQNPGGLNLFGKGFGNYDQNIEVSIEY
jgi:predicted transcriptional regulator